MFEFLGQLYYWIVTSETRGPKGPEILTWIRLDDVTLCCGGLRLALEIQNLILFEDFQDSILDVGSRSGDGTQAVNINLVNN